MLKMPKLLSIPLALLLTCPAASAQGLLPKKTQDFLPVDQAFELQPLELREGRLEVRWRIAKDYYLYKDRLKFTLTAPAGAALGAPVLPTGEPYHDEHFGDVIVFRQELIARLSVTGGAPPYALTVVYQGCADQGLCYPPQTRTLESGR